MNHSYKLDQYIQERSWTLNKITRKGKTSFNVYTQDQSKILLVDYYPQSGRAYLHLKTLQQHNVEYSLFLGDLKTVGTGEQIGYNLSHITEWSTVKSILDQLDDQNQRNIRNTVSQNTIIQGHKKSFNSSKATLLAEDYGHQFTNKHNENTWTFKPVNKEQWADVNPRILLLGAEPNGDNDYSGAQDMGEWFHSATLNNNYSKNRRFFTCNIAQLSGALGTCHFHQIHSLHAKEIDQLYKSGIITKMLSHLRYADLKASGGGAVAVTERVTEYVRNHLEKVLQFWNPIGNYCPPTHTVVQGAHAHQVFMNIVRPELQKRDWPGFYIGMPHPSAQILSYESLRNGTVEMLAHFKPFTDPNGVRWNGDSWVKIK